MSQQPVCDGCGKPLNGNNEAAAITGERSNGLRDGCLPDGSFDWCYACAHIAFDAVLKHYLDQAKA